MLSKKYYKEIAKILRDTKAEITNIPNCTPEIAVQIIQKKLETLFESDNPKFDIVRFREATEI